MLLALDVAVSQRFDCAIGLSHGEERVVLLVRDFERLFHSFRVHPHLSPQQLLLQSFPLVRIQVRLETQLVVPELFVQLGLLAQSLH